MVSKEKCEWCGGTGQISYFKGVSRFLLSWDECPECCGTGRCEPHSSESKGRPPRGEEKEGDNQERE